jgi:uncharacterized protein with GYD domain
LPEEVVWMPKYLFRGGYSQQGVQGLLKEGAASRQDAIGKLAADMGGSLEGFYFGFGDADFHVICDLPDKETAAAISLAVAASGAAAIETIVLMTPEEIDQARGKTVNYRPPGA